MRDDLGRRAATRLRRALDVELQHMAVGWVSE
jgi:hypothetical protein